MGRAPTSRRSRSVCGGLDRRGGGPQVPAGSCGPKVRCLATSSATAQYRAEHRGAGARPRCLADGRVDRVRTRRATSTSTRCSRFRRAGVVPWRYDKVHLVPFGEYVPLAGQIAFLRPLVREVGSFTPGRSALPLPGPAGPVGLAVCYEVTYPSLYRRGGASRRRGPRHHHQRRLVRRLGGAAAAPGAGVAAGGREPALPRSGGEHRDLGDHRSLRPGRRRARDRPRGRRRRRGSRPAPV